MFVYFADQNKKFAYYGTQFNIFLALPPSVPPRNYDILMDRHKSKSRQYIDRRERLGRVTRVNSGETFMSKLGVLPSAAINTIHRKLLDSDWLRAKQEQNLETRQEKSTWRYVIVQFGKQHARVGFSKTIKIALFSLQMSLCSLQFLGNTCTYIHRRPNLTLCY